MSGRSWGATVLASLLVLSCWVGLGSGRGVAQGQQPEKRITLNYEQKDIKVALDHLFTHFSGRYTLAAEVQGSVTAQLSNVLMEQALANILGQVNATWRVKDGIYEIVLKPQPEPIDEEIQAEAERRLHGEDVRVAIWRFMRSVNTPYSISPDVKGRIKIRDDEFKGLSFEAAFQNLLTKANATCRIEGGFYEILPNGQQDPGQKLVNASFEGEDVRDAIRTIFRSVEIPYSTAVEIQGTVTVNFKNTRLNDALTTMLSQVNATYQVEGGVYQIVLRKPSRVNVHSPDPANYSGKIITREMMQGPVSMSQDNKFIYILKGEVLYKVNKSDLKTVAIGRLGQ